MIEARIFALYIAAVEDVTWTAAALEPFTKWFCVELQVNLTDLCQAVRVAVTGREVGVSIFDTLEILGKASSLTRMRAAFEQAREDS